MAAAPVLPASPAPTPEPAPLSQGARIINTFIAPSKTFTDLRRSASWWAPFLLTTIISVGLVYVAAQKIGFAKIVENQMQSQPKAQERFEKLTPAQREQQIKITGISYYVIIPVFTLIIWLVIAALQFATFKFGTNADITYSRTLAVVAYGGLPLVIKALLAIVSVLAGVNPDGFSMQNPVATNPGYLMNPADGVFLYGLASALDVFMIWTLVLTAIGFTCAGKIKSTTAYVVVFGWWALLTVVFTGIGAAFS
jgi:hypothetical protein